MLNYVSWVIYVKISIIQNIYFKIVITEYMWAICRIYLRGVNEFSRTGGL